MSVTHPGGRGQLAERGSLELRGEVWDGEEEFKVSIGQYVKPCAHPHSADREGRQAEGWPWGTPTLRGLVQEKDPAKGQQPTGSAWRGESLRRGAWPVTANDLRRLRGMRTENGASASVPQEALAPENHLMGSHGDESPVGKAGGEAAKVELTSQNNSVWCWEGSRKVGWRMEEGVGSRDFTGCPLGIFGQPSRERVISDEEVRGQLQEKSPSESQRGPSV